MMEPSASPKVSGHWSPYFVSSDSQEMRAMVGRNVIDHHLEHKARRQRAVTAIFRTAALRDCTLHDLAYSMAGEGEATIHVPRMANMYLFEMNLSGEMTVGQDRATVAFRPGDVYMINADAPHAKIWHTGGRQLMIKIRKPVMETALQRLIGAPVDAPVRFDTRPQSPDGSVATLRRMIEAMVADLELERSAFAFSGAGGGERMILELMLHSIPHNYSHLLGRPEYPVRPGHVRRAAEYVHARSADPISLADIVRASGVGERTLQEGFRRFYGVSPMTYVRNVRLDRARVRLEGGGVSVTGAAFECGFAHLGKFAKAYRDRFGELPSETLRGG